MKHFVETYTGKYVDLENPKPHMIDIVDIAHGLSKLCRFGGAVSKFYSVAEHAVVMSSYNHSLEVKQWFLLHDAAECYTGEILGPFKAMFDEIAWREDIILLTVAEKFGLIIPPPLEEIKFMDQQMCLLEAQQLLKSKGSWCKVEREIVGINLECWEPEIAKSEFLIQYKKLFG